jgi:gliding motility-associated-like protein
MTLTVTIVPDLTPPGDITNLKAVTGAQDGQVNLTWTSPGDNGFIGDLIGGSFRLQYSTSPITSFVDPANIVIATNSAVLSTQSYVVQGLTPGDTYYFAMVALDQYGNRGFWSVGGGNNPENFARAGFTQGIPGRVSDLGASAGTGEGDVNLSWTAPASLPGAPITSYQVRFASVSVADLAGDTTAWWSLAASSSANAGASQPPGGAESLVIPGLAPNTTFYFAIRSIDSSGEISLIDADSSGGTQAFSLPRNLAPALPGGLTAAAGLRRALLSWNDLTPAQRGLDFKEFQLYRSTEAAANYVRVATTTLLARTDRPLVAFTTYYYRLSAIDFGANESALTSPVAVTPFTIIPMEPLGVRISPSSGSVTLSWSPTTRFADGTPFESVGTPDGDELLGYSIRRSTDMTLLPLFPLLSSATPAQSSYTDVNNGDPYYYQIKSFNRLGYSTATLVLSSLGEQSYFLDDQATRVILSETQSEVLSKLSNSLGADIQILGSRKPEETGGPVIQAVEFKAMLDGVKELKTFHFDKPARVILHFNTAGGEPTADPSALGAQSAPASIGARAEAAKNIGMYWHNGVEYKKLYGKVDPQAQTVTVETPNMGKFQLRKLLRSDSAVFDLSNISARVITPNDDGLNDTLIFTYDPGPNNVLPTGQIYDTHGALVAEMASGLVPNTLTWDGKMNGRAVTSGVYVYLMKGDGKTFSGTIVVAR